MLGVTVDWTQVLIVGIPAYISALFAGWAMVKAAGVHRAVRTPSGKPIGQVAEYAHDTAIANNMLLSKHNGPTKPAEADTLRQEGKSPPRIPQDPR